jgi:hypothetical protein
MERVLKAPDVAQLESNVRVQEAEQVVVDRVGDFLDRLDEPTSQAIVACVILIYLLFCFLCRCICVKTSNPPSPLIWLPFLKMIPMLKAAGMSPAWILSAFLPPVFAVGYIIWCFKIVRARAKKSIFAVMLLLPGTNLLAFVYLALSGNGAEEEKPRSKLIQLSPSPRRDAA